MTIGATTRGILLAGLLAWALAPAPAVAGWQTTRVTFTAPVPCGVACPGWHLGSPPGMPNLGADGEQACSPEPLAPDGSWDQVVINLPHEIDGAPPTHLEFAIEYALGGITWLCRVGDEGWEPVATGSVSPNDDCPFGGLSPGWPVEDCHDGAVVDAVPGATYVFRVYNERDLGSFHGYYRVWW